jgi:hypothetical protein
MENKLEIEFRSISTAVSCPICQKRYALKLSTDYLSRHVGEQIQTICLDCYKTRFSEIKFFLEKIKMGGNFNGN